MSTDLSRSPLAPDVPATLPPIRGVALASAETGTKYRNRPDLMLAAMPETTAAAGVFTRSGVASAPVDWCRALIGRNRARARALLVNAGNANAFVGAEGARAAEACAAALAGRLDCSAQEVFLASTGVIGEPLDPAPIVAALDAMTASAAPGRWGEAAAAIMTTDTFPKLATRSASLGGSNVRINGIAKGSGMIAPDMATMLAFLFTDAVLPAAVLQPLLASAVDRSFNCISVDGDTSTSDTVLLFATGTAGNAPVRAAHDGALDGFRAALDEICLDLAVQIVRDGEGAQKLVAVEVTGAEDDAAARRIALSIANSPLVKTAIAGADANWGRIVMAIGKSGETVVRDRISLWIGGVRVAREGRADPDYREAQVAAHMAGREIDIRADLGVDGGAARVWTCDLTRGYIEINADYRS